jgi:hypothetical protein
MIHIKVWYMNMRIWDPYSSFAISCCWVLMLCNRYFTKTIHILWKSCLFFVNLWPLFFEMWNLIWTMIIRYTPRQHVIYIFKESARKLLIILAGRLAKLQILQIYRRKIWLWIMNSWWISIYFQSENYSERTFDLVSYFQR